MRHPFSPQVRRAAQRVVASSCLAWLPGCELVGVPDLVQDAAVYEALPVASTNGDAARCDSGACPPPSETDTRVHDAGRPDARTPFGDPGQSAPSTQLTGSATVTFAATSPLGGDGRAPAEVGSGGPDADRPKSELDASAGADAGIDAPVDVSQTDAGHLPGASSSVGSVPPPVLDPDHSHAAWLDGVDDYFEVFQPERFNVRQGEFTIACWYYRASGAEHGTLFSKGNALATTGELEPYPGYMLALAYGKLGIYLSDGVTSVGAEITSPPAGQWHHVTGLRTGDNLQLYLDGTLADEIALPLDFSVETQLPVLVGAGFSFQPDNIAQGGLDDVAFFSRALGGAEISALVASGLDTKAPALVGYWPFDGETTRDFSANDLGSVVSGSPQFRAVDLPWASSDSGSNASIEFDGAADYLQVVPAEAFNPGVGDFTLATWGYFTPAQAPFASGAFVSKGRPRDWSPGAAHYPGFYLGLVNGRIAFNVDDNADWAGSNILAPGPGVWFHAAAVRRGGQVELLLNGRLASSTSFSETANILAEGEPLLIGASHATVPTDFFRGQLDDVALYRRALSIDEVRNLAAQGPDLRDDSLAGHWSFEDGQNLGENLASQSLAAVILGRPQSVSGSR